MKIKLVKTKYSDETFYVEYNDKLGVWERIGSSKYYHSDDLIFIRDV
jgi:hypothetical protein